MNEAADVVIAGGGPAGTAAGIRARHLGLRAILFESRPFPRNRPGETLHPGAGAILRNLGVLQAVEEASPVRPAAVETTWAGVTTISAYDAATGAGAFQILRRDLDLILQEEFIRLGGQVVQPAGRLRPAIGHGRVVGVLGEGLAVEAPVTIDASGASGFLRRAIPVPVSRHSPRLIAHYGYRQGRVGANPTMVGDASGWTWVAQVGPELISWARLPFEAGGGVCEPASLATFPEVERGGAVDVTWRRAHDFAGPGYFLAGDAAMVLDPACSHGVLRALMSGMMAADCAARGLSGATTSRLAAQAYDAWMHTWFQHDIRSMRDLYARLGV